MRKQLRNGYYHVLEPDGTEASRYRSLAPAVRQADAAEGRYVVNEEGEVAYRNGPDAAKDSPGGGDEGPEPGKVRVQDAETGIQGEAVADTQEEPDPQEEPDLQEGPAKDSETSEGLETLEAQDALKSPATPDLQDTTDISSAATPVTVTAAAGSQDGSPKAAGTVTLRRLMNIRRAPSLKADIITTKRKGEALPATGLKDGWLTVIIDGKAAFMLYENGRNGTLSGL